MSQLRYLMEEICAGVEIYYTGRIGGQYLKASFILCDDYTELTSKLFLLTDDPNWTDEKPGGTPKPGKTPKKRFKSYHDILVDVQGVFAAKRPADLPAVMTLHASMRANRDRRNDFFHSTRLLDLSVTQPRCVEAFCGLFDYGELLFPSDWRDAIDSSRNLGTLEILLRLEKKAIKDPRVLPLMNQVLADWPRNHSNSGKKGVHLAYHPEDMHLRLCVTCGGKELRDKLILLL